MSSQRNTIVFEAGRERPIEPHGKDTIDDDLTGCFTAEEWANARTDTVTWDDVRHAFAGIAGSLSETVAAQRQEP